MYSSNEYFRILLHIADKNKTFSHIADVANHLTSLAVVCEVPGSIPALGMFSEKFMSCMLKIT